MEETVDCRPASSKYVADAPSAPSATLGTTMQADEFHDPIEMAGAENGGHVHRQTVIGSGLAKKAGGSSVRSRSGGTSQRPHRSTSVEKMRFKPGDYLRSIASPVRHRGVIRYETRTTAPTLARAFVDEESAATSSSVHQPIPNHANNVNTLPDPSASSPTSVLPSSTAAKKAAADFGVLDSALSPRIAIYRGTRAAPTAGAQTDDALPSRVLGALRSPSSDGVSKKPRQSSYTATTVSSVNRTVRSRPYTGVLQPAAAVPVAAPTLAAPSVLSTGITLIAPPSSSSSGSTTVGNSSVLSTNLSMTGLVERRPSIGTRNIYRHVQSSGYGTSATLSQDTAHIRSRSRSSGGSHRIGATRAGYDSAAPVTELAIPAPAPAAPIAPKAAGPVSVTPSPKPIEAVSPTTSTSESLSSQRDGSARLPSPRKVRVAQPPSAQPAQPLSARYAPDSLVKRRELIGAPITTRPYATPTSDAIQMYLKARQRNAAKLTMGVTAAGSPYTASVLKRAPESSGAPATSTAASTRGPSEMPEELRRMRGDHREHPSSHSIPARPQTPPSSHRRVAAMAAAGLPIAPASSSTDAAASSAAIPKRNAAIANVGSASPEMEIVVAPRSAVAVHPASSVAPVKSPITLPSQVTTFTTHPNASTSAAICSDGVPPEQPPTEPAIYATAGLYSTSLPQPLVCGSISPATCNAASFARSSSKDGADPAMVPSSHSTPALTPGLTCSNASTSPAPLYAHPSNTSSPSTTSESFPPSPESTQPASRASTPGPSSHQPQPGASSSSFSSETQPICASVETAPPVAPPPSYSAAPPPIPIPPPQPVIEKIASPISAVNIPAPAAILEGGAPSPQTPLAPQFESYTTKPVTTKPIAQPPTTTAAAPIPNSSATTLASPPATLPSLPPPPVSQSSTSSAIPITLPQPLPPGVSLYIEEVPTSPLPPPVAVPPARPVSISREPQPEPRRGDPNLVRIGELFNGQYEVVRKLGAGDWSTVWLAFDRVRKLFLALKISKETRSKAFHEVNMYTLLNHSLDDGAWERGGGNHHAVIRMLDAFEAKVAGGLNCIMVFEVLGHDLLSLITNPNGTLTYKGIPIPRVKKIAKHALQGLAYIHEVMHVFHCDLKPENILLNDPLTESGSLREAASKYICQVMGIQPPRRLSTVELLPHFRASAHNDYNGVKIIDMGASREVGDTMYSVDMIQTLEYRSPEVVLGFSKVGTAIDVWSLACIIWEMLTGVYFINPGEDKPRNPNHVALFMSRLGELPKSMSRAEGKHVQFFFDKNGTFRFPGLAYVGFSDLVTKHGYSQQQADEIVDFLAPMLRYVPEERASAQQMLSHPWLADFS